MPGVPGPDGRHDDLDADQLEGLALLVPDDARSLDADRDAYLRELRQRRWSRGAQSAAGAPGALGALGAPRRGDGRRRSLLTRALGASGPGSGLFGPVLLVLLVVVGLLGSTLSVFSGNAPAAIGQTPLATDTSQPVGTVGGLLPNTTVTVGGSEYALRGARPAVLVLVPTSCPDCGAVLRSLRGQIAEYGSLRWLLVGPADQQDQLRSLNTKELGGGGIVATDGADLVRAAFSPAGITAVMVRDDGVVALVSKNLTTADHLETALAQLDGRAAPTL